MQDKEIDRLFKDTLQEAELQPAPDLWGKIVGKIEPQKRRPIPVFWMAAAAAVALMVVGLFFTKTEKVRLQGAAPLAENLPMSAEAPLPEVLDQTAAAPEPYSGTPLVIAPSFDLNYNASDNDPQPKASKKLSVAVQPAGRDTRLSNSLPVAVEPMDEKDNWQNKELAINTNQDDVPSGEVINENDQMEKKSIRNVGDLVNFIVEKVDKREQKLLKFSTDDDHSSLTAINIGVLKINRKSNK